MPHLASRPWVPAASEALIQRLARETSAPSDSVTARIEALITRNLAIHDHECFNLNPATNVMNPKAEAVLARGLGSRPSLGYPGDKYEMGLEAIEAIEVICAELAAEVFQAKYAEIRVGSGALANLYGFMALTRPGDAIIAPDPAIGGHVTHHATGCAGLYGLITHAAPVDADVVGAHLLFDAAHQCGMIAGGRFPNPLSQGAHLMTMSTYKSLGGPAGGLIVTNDAAIAERLDAIAFPGMTANFDAGKSAALALTLLDRRDLVPAMPQRWSIWPRPSPPPSPPSACRSMPSPGGPPKATSSPFRQQASAADRRRRKPCARPGFWPAASACRSRRCRAT